LLAAISCVLQFIHTDPRPAKTQDMTEAKHYNTDALQLARRRQVED